MNSYERVMATLRKNKNDVDRLPCINSASVSTMEFMKTYDAFWPDAHKDPEKMAKLSSAAYRLCGLDNITVPFCMTVEAEILGATIEFNQNNIKWPTVRKFNVKEFSDLTFPKDVTKTGRVPVIIEAIKKLKHEFDGEVPINVYLAPPFTCISSYLVNSITFLKWLRRAPDKVHEFLKGTLNIYTEIAKSYQDAGADIITLHCMGASNDNISPNHFKEFVKPYLKKIIQELNLPTILNICGSASMIIDQMLDCDANGIAVDERTPIKKIRKIVDRIKPNYPIIGNIPAYGVIHQGPIERIREAVKRVIAEGVDMVAPGCDFFLETPTKNVKAFVDATKEFGTKKKKKS